jgi:outer membrane lipoprotein
MHAKPTGGLASLALLGILLSAGCASQVPPTIRGEVPTAAVSVDQARRDPTRHAGQLVRWGGTLLVVHNLRDSTDIEILSRPLGADGKPRADAEGSGRFLARLAGFVDPAEYPTGRLITVVGTIDGIESRLVGDFPYAYPVVAVTRHHLWPEEKACPRDYSCGYLYDGYGPWYGPWYPPLHPFWYGPRPWPW